MGREEFLKTKLKTTVYNNPQDAAAGRITIIDRPFWKSPVKCYTDILLFCELSEEDYPCQIGPHVNPIHLLSYMESMFQLTNCLYVIFNYV